MVPVADATDSYSIHTTPASGINKTSAVPTLLSLSLQLFSFHLLMSNSSRSSNQNARARQTRAQAEAELFKYDDSANLCMLETSPVSGAERWVQLTRPVTRSACRNPSASSIHSQSNTHSNTHSSGHSHIHSTPEPTHKLPTPRFEPEISDDQGPDLTDDQEDEGVDLVPEPDDLLPAPAIRKRVFETVINKNMRRRRGKVVSDPDPDDSASESRIDWWKLLLLMVAAAALISIISAGLWCCFSFEPIQVIPVKEPEAIVVTPAPVQQLVINAQSAAERQAEEERIKKLEREVERLKYELRLIGADKTGMADYALESVGGQVIGTRCSQTYKPNNEKWSLFGVTVYSTAKSPRTVIQPGVEPGNCWAFAGTTGFLVLKLARPIRITAVTYEHTPRDLVPSGDISSAPRDFTIIGLSSEEDEAGEILGHFTFVSSGESLQTFTLGYPTRKVYQFVELRIDTNSGNKDFTCLYRFRVHGVEPVI